MWCRVPDQIMLEEEAGLGAPNLHPSGIVNSEVTDSRECTGLEKNLKKTPTKPFLISGETPAEESHTGCV